MDKNEFTKMNNEIIFLENMKQKKRSDMFSYEFRSCLFVFSLLLLMINPRSPLPDWGVTWRARLTSAPIFRYSA